MPQGVSEITVVIHAMAGVMPALHCPGIRTTRQLLTTSIGGSVLSGFLEGYPFAHRNVFELVGKSF